ncbi:hypothetical protein HK102_011098, partial [Quaeritorhiza haematococci]
PERQRPGRPRADRRPRPPHPPRVRREGPAGVDRPRRGEDRRRQDREAPRLRHRRRRRLPLPLVAPRRPRRRHPLLPRALLPHRPADGV